MATQQEINDGQRNINGELCRVDWRIIEALRAVKAVLAACPGCAGVSLTALDSAIKAADSVSDKVADIKPPGCDPEKRTT